MDAAKLTAAIAGNVRARAAVLRSLQDDWFRYALANLLSVSAARDATQEAGLRVLHRLSSYDPKADGPIGVWSLGAVVTAVREVRQLNGAAPPLLAAARAHGLSAAPPRFSRLAADAADGLSPALSPMAPAQREAVVLRLLRHLPTTRTATLLATDPATVRSEAVAGLAALPSSDDRLRTRLTSARDWLALAAYPGDLRTELFRAHKPRWLIPAAATLLAGSVALVSLAKRFHPPASPAGRPATSSATR